MRNRKQSAKCSGFSLVEVSIAMAIAAVALISIVGMIPTATKGSADSADQTAIGTMFEDIADRIKGKPLVPGPVEGKDYSAFGFNTTNIRPFYYDLRGSYIDPDTSVNRTASIVTDPYYRVELQLIKPVAGSPAPANFENSLAVQVKIFWPIDDKGEAVFPKKPGSEITFLAGAQTGPAWTDIDPNYQPKIEY